MRKNINIFKTSDSLFKMSKAKVVKKKNIEIRSNYSPALLIDRNIKLAKIINKSLVKIDQSPYVKSRMASSIDK